MSHNVPMLLPDRYSDFRGPFETTILRLLRPGAEILDIGSGRKPAISRELRPRDCTYVGMDISAKELSKAPVGAYDSVVVADVVSGIEELSGRFDLAVSWQVLEHVKPLRHALDNIRTYLRPGGTLVAHLSGTFSVFGLANRVVPHSVAKVAMYTLLKRDPETVFPAHYDDCWAGALCRLGQDWSSFSVVPRFTGATYFQFLPPLQKLYLSYENQIAKRKMDNLATHYLVVGTK